MAQIYSRIIATGSALPERVVTNADLEKFVDTSDEWIRERTGIRQRHIAADGETTGDLATLAAQRALEAAGVKASELDLIVMGTTTPDIIFPSTACLVQHRLGANGCAAFDVKGWIDQRLGSIAGALRVPLMALVCMIGSGASKPRPCRRARPRGYARGSGSIRPASHRPRRRQAR